MSDTTEASKSKNIWQTWMDIPLVLRIICGIIIGIILALTVPQAGESLQWLSDLIELLGKLFTTALKAVAPILVFFLVVSSIMNAKTAGNLKTVIILYLIATGLSAVVAVIACHLFPLTLVWPSSGSGAEVEQTSPGSVGEVFTNVIVGMVSNPINALAEGSFLPILFWAAIMGIALRHARNATKEVMQDISEATMTAVIWVINLAPFGIMGLVYSAITAAGMEIFISYFYVVVLLVSCMLLMTLVINPLIVFICIRKNPYLLLWRTLTDSWLTAFFTRSSAANVPMNLALCEKLGLDEESYSVSIPLGATINMGGAAITISIMTMCAANTLGIQVEPAQAVILCVIGALGACGASGVAGGSLLLIPIACSLFGIPSDVAMDVVAIGFIIGVIQDSFETAQNSSTDVLFTATADYMKQRKEGKEIHPGEYVNGAII